MFKIIGFGINKNKSGPNKQQWLIFNSSAQNVVQEQTVCTYGASEEQTAEAWRRGKRLGLFFGEEFVAPAEPTSHGHVFH